MDYKEKAQAVLEQWRRGISGSKLVREVAAKAELELLHGVDPNSTPEDDQNDALTRGAASEHSDLIMLEILGRALGGHYWIARGCLYRINKKLNLSGVQDPEVMGEMLRKIQMEELCAAFQVVEELPK